MYLKMQWFQFPFKIDSSVIIFNILVSNTQVTQPGKDTAWIVK